MHSFIVVYGPQACGKTRNAERMRKHFGLDNIVDDWRGTLDVKHGRALYITNEDRVVKAAQDHGMVVMSFAEVADRINCRIPKTDWQHSKPERVGVYEVEDTHGSFRCKSFAYWNGRRFGFRVVSGDAQRAFDKRKFKTCLPALAPWRGLAEEPIVLSGGCMKVAELTGVLLDYWVANAEGRRLELRDGEWFVANDAGDWMLELEFWTPHKDWAQGGPIIEREKICIDAGDGLYPYHKAWAAWLASNAPVHAHEESPGHTPLVAAMRAYVASKFGAEVPEVPA